MARSGSSWSAGASVNPRAASGLYSLLAWRVTPAFDFAGFEMAPPGRSPMKPPGGGGDFAAGTAATEDRRFTFGIRPARPTHHT